LNVLKIKENKVILALNTFEKKEVTLKKNELKEQLGIVHDTFVIGSVGELAKRKGHHVLINAIQLLIKKHNINIKLLIIGDGSEKKTLQKEINNNGLSNNILMISFTDNIFNYYNIMDLYTHPTIAADDLPFAVREAMSIGLPIVASNYAGIPEIVQHGYNGMLVEPNHPEKLFEEIYNLIIDNDKRTLLGENSFKVFEEKLSKKVILNNYKRIFTRYTT
jgi:glycosyltransferase involved in cell wall biosynthesis